MTRTLALTLTCLLLACGGDRIRRTPNTPPVPDPACGDGNLDEGEQCDGSNLGEESCQSQGFDTGTLLCTDTCQFATTQCVRRCGNGQIDLSEACDGALGPLTCGRFGVKTCTSTCEIDERSCTDTPYETGPALEANPGGPAILTDLNPKGRADLVLAVKARARLEVFAWTQGTGFGGARFIGSDGLPVRPFAADLNGDGAMDLAAIHDDGSVSRFVSGGEAFVESELLSNTAECAASEFVGVLPPSRLVLLGCPGSGAVSTWEKVLILDPSATPPGVESVQPNTATDVAIGDVLLDGVTDLLVTQSGSTELISWSEGASGWEAGPNFSLTAPREGIELADLDGDGDQDLVVRTGASVEVFERTPTDFASRLSMSGPGIELAVADLDGDGRVDLLWRENAKIELRRNQGDFTFSAYSVDYAPMNHQSLNVGDVDGDGDVDLVATDRVADQLTRSQVFLNQVK